MRIRLTKDILDDEQNIRFKTCQEFNVHPSINRFDVEVHEVADGTALGVMFHKSDCEVIVDVDDTVPASEYDSMMQLHIDTLKELTEVRQELDTVKKENTRLKRIERRQQRKFNNASN